MGLSKCAIPTGLLMRRVTRCGKRIHQHASHLRSPSASRFPGHTPVLTMWPQLYANLSRFAVKSSGMSVKSNTAKSHSSKRFISTRRFVTCQMMSSSIDQQLHLDSKNQKSKIGYYHVPLLLAF